MVSHTIYHKQLNLLEIVRQPYPKTLKEANLRAVLKAPLGNVLIYGVELGRELKLYLEYKRKK